MSVECLRFAATATDLTLAERGVLLMLADRADKQGICFAGQDYIAKKLGTTQKTVRTALQGLERKGKIYRQERRNSMGFRTSDSIKILTVNFSQSKRSILPCIPTSPYGVGIKEEEGAVGEEVSFSEAAE